MYVNREEQSIVTKVCFWGPPGIGKGALLEALFSHFSSASGEHTAFDRKEFAPKKALADELGDDAEAFILAASESLGVPYDELTEAGELVFFRTRVSAGGDDQFSVYVDSYTVSGETDSDALRDFSLKGADCVVFVADGVDEEATLEQWSALNDHAWNGKTVLLVQGVNFSDETEELLEFEGRAFAEKAGFEHSLEAFYAACELALDHARKSN